MKPDKLYQLLSNQWAFALFLFLLLLLITINHPMFCDEGFWHYIASIWAEDGLAPYLHSVENKPPGIYYLYMLSNWLFGVNVMFVRLLGIVSILFSAILVKRLIERFSNESAGLIGMYVFGLSNTWYIVDGHYPAVTESFMLLFVLLAFLRFTRAYPNSPKGVDFLIAGILLGCAVSFKQIAVFSGLAFILFYFMLYVKSFNLASHVKNTFLIIGSALFAHLLFVFPVLFSGVSFAEYFNGVWLILLDDGTLQGDVQALYDFFGDWFNSKLFIFWLVIPLAFFKRDIMKQKYVPAFFIWLFIDMLATSLPGTFNEHQFKPFLFPATVLFSVLFASLLNVDLRNDKKKIQFSYFLIGLIIVLFPYRNVIINGYLEGFPDNTVQVGKWIEENTDEDKSLFVFDYGSAGIIMAYSDRICPVPNFNLVFVNTLDEYKALNENLLKNMPDILVINNTGYIDNNLLQDEMISQYQKIHQMHGFDICSLKTNN
ncbi:MAG: glycosyltransferase family 39 protein [Bacteroidota bacterium]|nr:glycosyltransferase family 39 protein [Bacteroidota bacterium]